MSMKKIRLIIIALAVFVTFGTVSGKANDTGEDGMTVFLLDFTGITETVAQENVTLSFDDGVLSASLTGSPDGEAKCVLNTAGLDADRYPYMKIKMRNRSKCDMFRFGFGNGEIDRASDTVVNFKSGEDGYSTYVINVAEANEETFPLSAVFYPEIGRPTGSLWHGPIDRLCLYFWFAGYGNSDFGENPSMDIAYIAFFENQDDAKAFDVKLDGEKALPSKYILIAGVVLIILLLVIFYGKSGKDSKKAVQKKTNNKKAVKK